MTTGDKQPDDRIHFRGVVDRSGWDCTDEHFDKTLGIIFRDLRRDIEDIRVEQLGKR